ncbi:hypothetical protein [Yinghuangia soli]|uniref:Uncharacterized protein n=1 Tax=Yinghuangia soli TaxID=2908204 RepID=A0AA41Q9A1_9ACTN|nr:hypothetical protein [Yinghuangia soli]MCF2533632.1 hypothetical protein [Yinghuangia soli]
MLLTAATFLATPASAAHPKPAGPILKSKLVTEAQPDECFREIGDHRPMPDSGKCPAGYQAKINQSYPWGGAVSGNYAYVGTGANIVCAGTQIFQYSTPYRSGGSVCEYGEGPDDSVERYGPGGGDSRTPKILQIDARTDAVKDITPVNDPYLPHVAGLRGGFAHGNLVILGGPVLASDGSGKTVGVGMFAFDGSTGRFLASTQDSTLGNVRVGVEASDGNLYVAARANGAFGGQILKWTGTLEDPFQYEVVGTLPNEGGYIIEHQGQLIVSGWAYTDPSAGIPGSVTHGPAQLWASRSLNSGPLTPADANGWKSFFSYTDYDPDPVIGKSMYWGALASWRGSLYVGTYQIDTHGTSILSLWNEYGRPTSERQKLADISNAARPTSVLRIDRPGADNQAVTLLYGKEKWPVRDANGTWTDTPNKLGQKPKFGDAGFNGNPYNAYSWTFTVFENKLYMATADLSSIVGQVAPLSQALLQESDLFRLYQEYIEGPRLRDQYGGGDIWRMDNPESPAVAETLNGFGNASRWGVRIFLPFPQLGHFYAGMGGGDNLRTGKDRGGFGVYKLTPGKPGKPVPPSKPHYGPVLPAFGGA